MLRYAFLLLCFSYPTFGAKYAALVLDANTRQVLDHHEGYSLRHPASLTKKMTLFLVFEAIKQKKITWETQFSVSDFATKQSPCKLWLKKGEKVTVKNLVMSLITRSANDSSVVLAEGLSGSQSSFVQKMNAKAKELGMTRTHFCNASGLPDSRQVTTAYDMAILGFELKKHFPAEFKLFNTRVFYYKGQAIQNHNHLLGIDGIHGIKTGYTVASGSNLTACSLRNDRYLITVVLGAPSRHWRDKRVRELFNKNFNTARKPYSPSQELEDAIETQETLDDILPLTPIDDEESIEEELEKVIPPPTVNISKKQVRKPKPLQPVSFKTIDGERIPNGWVVAKPTLEKPTSTQSIKKKK